MKNKPNVTGIDFERQERQPYHKGFFGRLVTIIITLIGILFVAWLLFNPVKVRPAAVDYVKEFDRIAAARGIPERLGAVLALDNGKTDYSLPESGLILTVRQDPDGYVTALELKSDPQISAAEGWQKLSATDLRDRLLLILKALDSSWTHTGLYNAFDSLGVDLDQPLSAQQLGTKTVEAAGLEFHLTHSQDMFIFSALLDILTE